MGFLTNRLVIALLVPILLLLAGGFGKKLIRGKGWHRKDWYLGVDASLAGFSGTLINFFELTRLKSLVPNQANVYNNQQIASAVFVAISFFLFLFVLALHQNWESEDSNVPAQRLWLLAVSNLIGLGLMFVFVYIIKGVE